MLLYDHIFLKDMCSMICQTTSRPDWPVHMTSSISCNFFEMILKTIFNNYLVLNEIEFVHNFFFMSTNKHIRCYLMSVRKFYGFYLERLFKVS